MARKPGRPPKHIGLTPVEDSDGDQLQDVRPGSEAPKRPVLPPMRLAPIKDAGSGGVFAAADSQHVGRGEPEAQPPAIPDASRGVLSASDILLSRDLKRILSEVAAPEFQDDPEINPFGKKRPMTNAEVLARRLIYKACQGRDAAMEAVIDRVEGKPGRTAQQKGSDDHISEQIDQALVNDLNRLVE